MKPARRRRAVKPLRRRLPGHPPAPLAAGPAALRTALRTVLVLALGLIFAACRTAPLPVERDLVAYLPADQGAYLFINDAATGEVVLEALFGGSVSADQLARVVDRTDLVVATVGRTPAPRLNLVAAGRYPRRIIERNLRRDPLWIETRLARGAPAGSYFSDVETGFEVAVLRSGLVLVSEGGIEARLEQAAAIEQGRIAAANAALETQLAAWESEAQRHQLTVHFPDPGREALSRFGAPIRMPLQDITVFFDRSEESVALAGVIRLESEQDARAFHVLFRLLFLAIVRDAGLDMQQLSAQLESQRSGSVVRFHGVELQPDGLRRLMQSFSARFVL